MQGILIVDKPMDWTSFDVVAKLRGVLGTRKLGHSGTLDPMATGVLPVFCGGASKAVDLQLNHNNGSGHGGRRGTTGRAATIHRPADAGAAHVLGHQAERSAAV